MAHYQVSLICDGVPPAQGAAAARCITEEFSKRDWHRNAVCSWDGHSLSLVVENDFDGRGRATMDEFSDALSMCVAGGFDGDMRVVSVVEMSP